MSILKINSTQIVNKIIRDQLISLSLTDIKWKVDEILWRFDIDPTTVPIEKKKNSLSSTCGKSNFRQ